MSEAEKSQEVSNEENLDNVEQESQEVDNQHEETQQASTGEQEDTSKSSDMNGSEAGIQKKTEPENVESGEDFSKNLDDLVSLALNDKLTDEHRQGLEQSGLSKHFDLIVSGRRAEIAKNDEEIFSVVGSKESYSELQEWAVNNLSDSEIDSFNQAVVESGNIGLAKLAVEGLQARYLKANGSEPSKVIESGGTSNESNRPFASRDEYIQEALSVRYKTDPEYAAEVEAKRNKSGF